MSVMTPHQYTYPKVVATGMASTPYPMPADRPVPATPAAR